MKNLFKNILGGVVATAILLGILYIIGLFVAFVETHLWVMIPLAIVAIIAIFKIAD